MNKNKNKKMEKDLTKKLYEELKKRNLFEEDDDDFENEEKEVDDVENQDEMDDSESLDSNDEFCDLVCNILHSRTQAHVFHLQTKSFAEHKALNDYYDGIVPLFDGIVESYQGKYGIIKTYKTIKIEQYKNKQKTIKFFENLLETIENTRDSVDDSFIQNQIDTVQELTNSTIYKLKFLN